MKDSVELLKACCGKRIARVFYRGFLDWHRNVGFEWHSVVRGIDLEFDDGSVLSLRDASLDHLCMGEERFADRADVSDHFSQEGDEYYVEVSSEQPWRPRLHSKIYEFKLYSYWEDPMLLEVLLENGLGFWIAAAESITDPPKFLLPSWNVVVLFDLDTGRKALFEPYADGMTSEVVQ